MLEAIKQPQWVQGTHVTGNDAWNIAQAVFPDIVPAPPSITMFPSWELPPPPVMPSIWPVEQRLGYLLKIYNHALGRISGKRVCINGGKVPKKGKLRSQMLVASDFFTGAARPQFTPETNDKIPAEISPGQWLCWSIEVWKQEYAAPKQPLPDIGWVYLPLRFRPKTVNIFTHQIESMMRRPPVPTKAGKLALDRYAQCKRLVMAQGFSSRLGLIDLVEPYAASLRNLSVAAKTEAAAQRAEAERIALTGAWLWH